MKKKLSESWWPPKDTFFSKGQTFVRNPLGKPKVSNPRVGVEFEKGPACRFGRGPGGASRASNSRKVVRVRSGGQDVASATFDDDGPYNSTGASIGGRTALPPFLRSWQNITRVGRIAAP